METYFNNIQKECPVRATLDLIAGKWKPAILCEIKDVRKRYSEIQASIPLITAQALTVQLKQLEADGLINRHHDKNQNKISYGLSELGESLSDVMDQLDNFGQKYLAFRNSKK